MKANDETKQMLRDTLERYVKDLADELLYWVGELNKLDAGDPPPSRPEDFSTGLHIDGQPWPARRRGLDAEERVSRPHGKEA